MRRVEKVTPTQPPTGAARHQQRPPRRDGGWLALLALTATGLLASFLVAGDDPGGPGGQAEPTGSASSSSQAGVDGTSRQADPGTGDPPSPASGSASSPAPSPSSPEVVTSGSGTLVAVPVAGKDSGRDGRTVRWTMEAEKGLGIDLEPVGALVRQVLQDRRGWETEEGVAFRYLTPKERKNGADVDVTVVLASPDKTDVLCAPLTTRGDVSCMQRGRVVLNSKRWLRGADAFGDDLEGYRTYLVNHEMGHALRYGHVQCPAKGERAPVMMQQTLSLGECEAWSWPVGDGVGRR
ncbi:DUF3152 domain-containing protein [Marihabitans asiaticum]|uniref:Uncharacterized protein DUF3152 n=1 Tax=Marihabitans asiaticum TaxID=415218 RepID=A0A560WGE0_9MICO|nr:uncharacterized protein DUF3152 [Marihabitans asiaticum]